MNHSRRGERLHHVAVVGAVVDIAVGSPHRFAGLLVEGHDVVIVVAVEVVEMESPIEMIGLHRIGHSLDADQELVELDAVRPRSV